MKDIYKLCVIENSEQDLAVLKNALFRYGKEHNLSFFITDFTSIESFLVAYKGNYDIIFFDIELPGKNGMDGAKLLREIDEEVTILFVTNLAKYAIEGYQVHAFDYILKPVVYERFAVKLSRVLSTLSRREKKFVLAKGLDGSRKIAVDTILYVEVMVHTLCYHLSGGETVEVTGKLSSLESELDDYGFARISRSFLVNMRYIASVKGSTVSLTTGEQFELSRNRNNDFKDKFMNYISRGGGKP